ncbi:MAG: hydantoinase/oxoprolinase family protein [Gammaproteobacteria bacterium]
MMKKYLIGWDIGGAHVKAALLDDNGNVLQVVQQSCPLWKGLFHLQMAIDAVLSELAVHDVGHAITMTGELVDCFDSREQGVAAIVRTLLSKLSPAEMLVFAGERGLLKAQDVTRADTMAIASANWIASAQFAAKRQVRALFVDIGSTTTDILLIENHALLAEGMTDYERLISGELLYTGIVRTPVIAVAQRAIFNGKEMGLMAEYFATMADVYRLTGDLCESHDQSDTADGGDKTPRASARRLSRMTGYEFDETDWPLWQAFAQELKCQQKQMIYHACLKQMQRSAQPYSLCLVGAGVGRFLVKELAGELQLDYVDFSRLFKQSSRVGALSAADCAPAAAVAYLAGGFG